VPPPPTGVRRIRLARLIRLVAVYLRIEVENMHQPRLLTGQDGTYFSFEETEPAGRGSSQSSRRQW
jgi:hypothetical protein